MLFCIFWHDEEVVNVYEDKIEILVGAYEPLKLQAKVNFLFCVDDAFRLILKAFQLIKSSYSF